MEALFGEKLVGPGGETSTAAALGGKTHVGIYFSVRKPFFVAPSELAPCLLRCGACSAAPPPIQRFKACPRVAQAHWCPPCRGFTPKLAEWYKAHAEKLGMEIVFASSDRDEGAFTEYFGEMPWLALPYSERDIKAKLSKKYKVNGIPSFVIVDAVTGELCTTNGRDGVAKARPGSSPFRGNPSLSGR